MDIEGRRNFYCLGIRLSALILSCSFLAGCHRNPAPVSASTSPPPPAQPSADTAERYFKAGKYPEAAQTYESFLNANPQVPDRDRFLFRLAVSYALAGGEPEYFRKARNLLLTIFTQFPDSEYKAETQYILSLQADIDRLRVDLHEKSYRVSEQDYTLSDKNKALKDKDKVLREKERILREKERALNERDTALKEKEDKIRKLTEELERMKKIDLQRRPLRPPG
jgi:tetratricopeptide (TPR) repeat protein